MWNKIRSSLPLQLIIAAAAAWLLATGITEFTTPSEVSTISQQSWYQLLMLGKTVYIGLLKMVVGVMVMLSLIEGISNIGAIAKLKTLGRRTVGFYIFTTTIAVSLGLGASLLLPPWEPLTQAVPIAAGTNLIEAEAASGSAIAGKMLQMALVNPVAAIANGNLLAVVVFAFMIGISLLIALPQEHVLFEVIRGMNKGINTLVSGIIRLSPLAIFAIIFEFSIGGSEALFSQLAMFSLLVFGLTMLHGLVVLPSLAKLFTGIKIRTLFKGISAPLAMAFATSSSAATLPLSMKSAEELGVTPATSSVVLPLGSVMNMDGTALFEGVAAIFLAQLFGVDLTTTGLIMIFIMAMVSSIGAPGMPSGSMSGMQLVLLAAGIPLEAIAILLIIERPLDTFRTAVNVEGDIIAALVVDKWQRS